MNDTNTLPDDAIPVYMSETVMSEEMWDFFCEKAAPAPDVRADTLAVLICTSKRMLGLRLLAEAESDLLDLLQK